MTPDTLRSGSVLKGREGIGGDRSQATTTARYSVVAVVAVKELMDRGIANPETFLDLAEPEAILGACRWFDAQQGRVGTGMLVNVLRGGGKPGWQPTQRRDLLTEQAEYERAIVAWLSANFPELCDPSPHPAAIAAVIGLHYLHGRGSLTVSQHGEFVRRAAAEWDERW